jgi:hypothetical protein
MLLRFGYYKASREPLRRMLPSEAHGVETPDQNLFTMRKNHSDPISSGPEDEFLGDPETGNQKLPQPRTVQTTPAT